MSKKNQNTLFIATLALVGFAFIFSSFFYSAKIDAAENTAAIELSSIQSVINDSLNAPNATGNSFSEEAKLLANDGAAQDQFGFSVAISGDTAVVGMPRDAIGSNQSQGAAYVYVRSGSTWTQQQKLTGSDSAATDQFGYAVAISGDTIAVGRYNTTTGQNRADGKVYIFKRAGATWTEAQTLVSSDLVQGDSFG